MKIQHILKNIYEFASVLFVISIFVFIIYQIGESIIFSIIYKDKYTIGKINEITGRGYKKRVVFTFTYKGKKYTGRSEYSDCDTSQQFIVSFLNVKPQKYSEILLYQ
jgi:hypothetical protein